MESKSGELNSMLSHEPETLFVRSSALASRVDDDLVFFDADAGKYFATGQVGAEIWELLQEPNSVESICQVLIQRYDVSEDDCRREVEKFIRDLAEAGLVDAC